MKTLDILFIEDDDDDVFLLKRVCKTLGIEKISFAANGRRAIEYLKPRLSEGSVGDSLIFLDLNMPEMNGFDFLRWFRGEAAMHTIPVIVLSTSENPIDMSTAYQLGANAYLVKAGDLKALTVMLQAAHTFWSQFNRLPPR
jgi:CheY-like chemotaxis protein